MSESSPSPLETHLELTEVSKDVFQNKDPHMPPGIGAVAVFGGTFIGQSLLAALKTVEPRFKPFSMHCNFLVGGDPKFRSEYRVKRTRDGKNYATRQVEVLQKGQVIFICTVSFQSRVLRGSSANLGPQLHHQTEPPRHTPPPEDMLDSKEGLSEWLSLKHVKPYVKNMEEKLLNSDMDPCIWRLPDDYFHGETATSSERHIPFEHRSIKFWFKTRPKIKDPQFNEVALAYCSDLFLLSSTTRLNFRNYGSLTFSVSLDHTIYFHKDFKADDWLLYEVKNPVCGGNRSLVTGHIYNQQGELIASTVQEGLAIIDDKNPFGTLAKSKL